MFSNSDSLFLNGKLLSRNLDYRFDKSSGGFDLSNLSISSADTLVVKYRSAPNWLSNSYGRAIPEISSNVSISSPKVPPVIAPPRLNPSSFSDISITGAKTFRVTTQTAGNSDFGQSLDLNVEGKLSDDLRISGTISDRGYNPSYGTSNSRLEELDKVNLKLQSSSFGAQVGDIIMSRRLYQESSSEKKITGASLDINKNGFGLNAVAARPKGTFESFSFIGMDGVQGPYQIVAGGKSLGIVPNSETVWLDGQILNRGADNDYTMDYPTGRITFSVRNLIDKRSRIEIDFEPISSDYETELYSTGSSYKTGDSSLFAAIEWYREGDIKSHPQLGDFSENDKALLESVGDNGELAFRGGANVDSNGSYIMVLDSLPDSVFQYVGEGNGTHSVTFSFVGKPNGEYKFAGGNNYYYVGLGNGDYQPIIKLPLPKRTEFYTSKLGVSNEVLGAVRADISVSRSDKNLFSPIDDNDNDGMLLNVAGKRTIEINGQDNVINVRLRKKEASFSAGSRINYADFSRNYFTPDNKVLYSDERLVETDLKMSPVKALSISPFYGNLSNKDEFSSQRFGFDSKLGDTSRFFTRIFWSRTESNLQDSLNGLGKASNWKGSVGSLLVEKVKLFGEIEHDNRHNDYDGPGRGIQFDRYAATIERTFEKVTYEYYLEDTLANVWSESLKRNRIGGSSIRRIGDFNYSTYFGYQWIIRPDSRAESFLNRTNAQYNDSRKQLSVSAAYTLSEETRNARGITYLQVDPGQGNYIYENGRYVPDANGNFIQVEELLSDQSSVNRGEKSIQFSKNWSFVQARFNSEIREELLIGGKRQIWWLVPFLSDENQPYLVYNRSYNCDVRIAPIKGGHAVNLSFDERIEIRNLGGVPQTRLDRAGTISIKQVIQTNYLEEQLKLFSSDRDSYYIGGGDIDGFKVSGSLRKPINNSEISIGLAFRNAESVQKESSKTISTIAESRFRLIQKGDLRNSLELYTQQLQNILGIPSYLLTDNKPGSRGAIWSTSFNYNVRKGMRINFSMSGRHSNESTARLFGRTEVVAEF